MGVFLLFSQLVFPCFEYSIRGRISAMQTFWGKVRQGDKRGRELGYPTANMFLHKNIEEGVYVSQVKVTSSSSGHSESRSSVVVWHPALTFIGQAKTFNKTDYKAESWLLDFKENLYGKTLTVKLLKKMRGNKKFDSAERLITQMKQDEKEAREYFTHR